MTAPQRRRRVSGIRPPARQQAVTASPKRSHPEISAARIAAIAALVGALIGALGAGVPVLISADRQISAENARVLRDQQRTAYAQFIATDDELTDAIVKYAIMMETTTGLGEDGQPSTEPPLPVPSPDEQKATAQKVYDGRARLNKDIGVIHLVGSGEAASIAREIRDCHLSIFAHQAFVRSENMSDEERRQSAKSLYDAYPRLSNAQYQFAIQARMDLGTDQVG